MLHFIIVLIKLYVIRKIDHEQNRDEKVLQYYLLSPDCTIRDVK